MLFQGQWFSLSASPPPPNNGGCLCTCGRGICLGTEFRLMLYGCVSMFPVKSAGTAEAQFLQGWQYCCAWFCHACWLCRGLANVHSLKLNLPTPPQASENLREPRKPDSLQVSQWPFTVGSCRDGRVWWSDHTDLLTRHGLSTYYALSSPAFNEFLWCACLWNILETVLCYSNPQP